MGAGEVDPFDLLLFPWFFTAGLLNVEVIGPAEFLGVSSSEVLLAFGSGQAETEITLALILTVVPFLLALVTNDWGFSAATGIQIYLVLATIGIMILPPFMPLLEYALSNSEAAAVVSLFIQSSGYISISYMG